MKSWRWPLSISRALSLVLPTALAWDVVLRAPRPTGLDRTVLLTLGPLWLVVVAVLAVRLGAKAWGAARGRGSWASCLRSAEVLTASGAATAWSGALAIASAVWIGWASLSVIGLMGLGLLHLVALWTLLRAGGVDPIGVGSVRRRFVPDVVVEGERVTEELTLSTPRIPVGFRLFLRGRWDKPGRSRWSESRYVVEASESRGDLVLESALGPARRGVHDAPPLELWLEDVLGLTRSVSVHAGCARLSVLPRPKAIELARGALGEGSVGAASEGARRPPTEGSLRLREYGSTDDARRIHWLRSLTAGTLIVRTPDENPESLPAVRLVLDTYLPKSQLACDGPEVLLDALVTVWLGLGRSLAAAGAEVTLVTASGEGGATAPWQERLNPRALSRAQRTGARAAWQDRLPVKDLVGDGAAIVVSFRLPATEEEARDRWVVVPGELWAPYTERPLAPSFGLLPFPMGSADNRYSRRRAEDDRRARARWDHASFSMMVAHSHRHRAGNLVARPRGDGAARLEVLS